MSKRIELPEHLRTAPFDRAALAGTRLSQGRLNRKDVTRPFHGVQSTSVPVTVVEHCTAYAVRMRPGQAFCHGTAALLHELPLPLRLQRALPLHVCSVRPASPPRTRDVVGHRLTVAPSAQELHGLAVCTPSETWCQLAPELTLDELIVIADHLLTVAPFDVAEARRVLERRITATRRTAKELLIAALAEARAPVRSPGETRVRLLLVRAGVREPALNAEVKDGGGRVLGHADLVWTAQRLVVEYEGDGHRTDKVQFRQDIERYERFRDAGWEVVRVTADDLIGRRRDLLVDRVRRRLERRPSGLGR